MASAQALSPQQDVSAQKPELCLTMALNASGPYSGDVQKSGKNTLSYSQGWLVGDKGVDGILVPFELAIGPGTGVITASGPVGRDLYRSIVLCSWTTRLLLDMKHVAVSQFDCHVNLPLHHIEGFGPSCRLPFAYALLEALIDSQLTDAPGSFALPSPAAETALTGDLTLQGDVLPVEGFASKLTAIRAAEFKCIVVATTQAEATAEMTRISRLTDLAVR